MADVMRPCPRCRRVFAGPQPAADLALVLHLQAAHGYRIATQDDADAAENERIHAFEAAR